MTIEHWRCCFHCVAVEFIGPQYKIRILSQLFCQKPVNLLIVLSTNVKVVKKEDLFTLWPFNVQVKFFSNTIINE